MAMASPWVAGQFVMWLIGVVVMAGGLTRMLWAFKADSLGAGLFVFVIGVLTLFAGFAVIAHPLYTSSILTLILAIYFFVDGFTEIMAAFAVPPGVDGKGWLLFDGAITVLLGLFIFSGFPLAGTFAIGVFLGIKLFLAGLSMLVLGSVAKRAVEI
jgi:uncharacterized membrane protein HdeD (DUF308 family)